MDPNLYRSVQECDLVSFLKQHEQNQLHEQLDGSENNLLHVCAQFHDSDEFVKDLLDQTQSSKKDKRFMLTAKNSDGETALHIASRNGRSNIVLALIERAKALDREYQNEELESGGAKIAEELMRATDKNGDTALHVAARNKHTDVVELLLTHDPHFKHPANTVKKTPLYLAAERGDSDIVDLILTKCKSQNYEGPGGKTILHAAVLTFSKRCIELIIQKNSALIRQADESGWIPLHYVAYFGHNSYFDTSPFIVDLLLEADRFTAYMRTSKDDNMTALHIAACKDNLSSMKKLLHHCPDSWNMVTSKGQNILHLVVASSERSEVLKFILDKKWAINLIHQKDAEGNTPLHLYAKRSSEDPVVDLDVSGLVSIYLIDSYDVNNQHFTPLDVMLTSENLAKGFKTEAQYKALRKLWYINFHTGNREVKSAYKYLDAYYKKNEAEKRQRMLEELRKRAETHLLVATLIATVTFAAGFTLPGGYDGNAGNNQGMAVLIRKSAFTTFVVTDAVALMSSLTAVFLHFSSTLLHDDDDDAMKFYQRQRRALVLIVIAMMTVVIAFVTGLYTVLQHGSLALAITICAMGCFVVLLFCFMLRREIITCLVYFFYSFLHIFSWYLAYKFLEYCKKRKIVGSEI